MRPVPWWRAVPGDGWQLIPPTRDESPTDGHAEIERWTQHYRRHYGLLRDEVKPRSPQPEADYWPDVLAYAGGYALPLASLRLAYAEKEHELLSLYHWHAPDHRREVLWELTGLMRAVISFEHLRLRRLRDEDFLDTLLGAVAIAVKELGVPADPGLLALDWKQPRIDTQARDAGLAGMGARSPLTAQVLRMLEAEARTRGTDAELWEPQLAQPDEGSIPLAIDLEAQEQARARLEVAYEQAGLSPSEIKALELVRGQGLDLGTAATVMGLTKSSVRTLLRRAEVKLSKLR